MLHGYHDVFLPLALPKDGVHDLRMQDLHCCITTYPIFHSQGLSIKHKFRLTQASITLPNDLKRLINVNSAKRKNLKNPWLSVMQHL